MDQKTVLMEKQIHSLEDLQSVIRLVEEKLKVTTKLVILLLESSSEDESYHQQMGIKVEDDIDDEGNTDKRKLVVL